MAEVLASKKSMLWIRVFSIAIPVAVAVLLGLPTKLDLGDWVYVLPDVIGVINTLTAIALVMALIAVKRKNIELHRKFNGLAFLLGAVFLVCYVLYHASAESTPYGGEGAIRYVYYTLLISHIVCPSEWCRWCCWLSFMP